MKKKLMLFMATIVMLLPLLFGLGSSLKVEAAGNVEIKLHKKRYSTDPGSTIQNTGEEMAQFDNVEGLGEVTFTVYDLTAKFYQLLETDYPGSSPTRKYTMNEASAEVKKDTIIASDGTSVTSGQTSNATGSVGDLDFTLADKSGGKNAVYVIVETAKAGVTKADNMVVALPITKTDGTVLSTIHLYPKNVVKTAGVEVEKISNLQDANGNKIPLEAVGFVIHRNGKYGATTGTEYLEKFDGLTPVWTTNKNNAYVYKTDASGKFKEERLQHGTYYLTEVSTIPGYTINNGAVDQEFTLSDTNETQLFTGDEAIKNDDIKLKKENTGGSVAVGEDINYTLTSIIPDGIRDQIDADGNGNLTPRYTKYEVKDSHGSHLKFNQSSLVVKDEDNDPFELTTDYTIAVNPSTDEFTISFTPAGIAKMKPGGTLTVTYSMKLLSVDPGVEVENTATITTDTDTDTGTGEKNYTGGYNFKKVDGSNDNEALVGAEFVVRDADDTNAKYLKVDETTGSVSWVDTYAEASKFTSGTGGIISVKGLKNGTYYLEETKTPNDKYVLLQNRIAFTVSKDSYDTTDPLNATPGTPLDVVNKQQGQLPSTGGSGIYLMVGLGLAAMAVAGVWYVRSQRKEA